MTLVTEAEARVWLTGLAEWDAGAAKRLELLATMLAEENQRQNLVSAASLEAIWLRHITDSAQLLDYVPRETSSPWLDLGTGAGFPGLVIAALRPEIELVMVESRLLRAEWLERVRTAMGLANARVIGLTLEKVPSRVFRVISARAFAPLPKLLTLSARFSTATTTWLLPKGRSARQELLDLTGWDHMFHVEQSLSDANAGIIVGALAATKGNSA